MGGIDNEMTTLVVPLTVAGAVLIASFLIVNATDYSHQHTSKVSAKAGYEVLLSDDRSTIGSKSIRMLSSDVLPAEVNNMLAYEDNSSSTNVHVIKDSSGEWAWAWVEIKDDTLHVEFLEPVDVNTVNLLRSRG